MINYDIQQDRTFKIINMIIADDIKRDPSRAKFYEERKAIAMAEAAAEKRRMEAQLKEQMEYLGLTEDDLKIEEELTQDGIPLKVLEELEAISRENEREYDKNLVEYMAHLEEESKKHKKFEELIAIAKGKGLKKPPFKNVNEAAYVASKKDNVINVEFNKNTVKVNLDTTPFKHKPVGGEVGGVQNRLNNNIKEVTIKEFAEGVAKNGYSFKAAQVAGKTNEDWIGQDIFALDIDNGDYKEFLEGKRKRENIRYPYLTMKEAYDRCIKYNIKPSFMYPSFSNTAEINKFRIVFRVPTTVTDLRVRRVIFNALINIFPERDKACKDLSRVFFGGCQEIYEFDEEAVLEPVELIQSMISYLRDTNNKNAASKIKTFCSQTGLNTINNMPYVIYTNSILKSEGMAAYPIIYNRVCGESVTFGFNVEKIDDIDIDKTTKKYKNINYKEDFKEEKIRNFNFDELESKCELWQDFINGSRWCFHSEVFGMATNMWRVEGAEKRMIQAIKDNEDYKDTYNKTNTIKSMRKYGYAPQRCESFCPYYSSCNCSCNMLTVVNNKQNNIRRVEEIKTKNIKDAEKELDTIINLSLKDTSNSINIIAAPTGIGKTTALVKNKELLKHNTIIAYPNHKLGKEIFNKFGLKDGEYIYLKDLEIENKEILTEYRRLQSLGAYGTANNCLEKYKNDLTIEYQNASNVEKNNILKELNIINEYMFYKKEAKITNKVIFCSHAMALLLKNNNVNQIIFDEDIFLSSCFSNIEINLNDLSVAINAASINENGSTYKQLLKLKEKVDIALATPNTIVNIPTFVIDDKEVNEIIRYNQHLNVNIKELLKTKIIISDIRGNIIGAYLKELPNKKCIVLSATANQTIYKTAFKDREVNFFDLGNVEQIGQVVLHYQSYSKQALNNNFNNLIKKIREEAPGIDNIISYKSFNDKFDNEGFNTIAHFGACAGIDAYNGQDLIVAGTPRPDARIYPLLANLLKPGTTTVENKQENVNIINNGWEFSIFTYDEGNGTTSGLLQQIQFYLIESEIAQAVGRARTLRTNATVHLFSNYPLRECILYNKNKKATTAVAA
ncbi:hypothetical protein [Clostridium baratii]|uniref:hypothetical protein n=1 Tax=Clostridium baratii TaxID=1561 RepID=UPI00290008D2|nr:hypothetical protein [Clostridium baratii]MDU1053428.1 hypothetical protein [Clostridium baratii]